MGNMTETIKALIIINVLFFIGKVISPQVFDSLFSLYYFESPNFQIWQPITHMFMHAGIGHIFFNMFGLYMFGAPLEARWGQKKFLFFYFSAGLGAALIHSFVNYLDFRDGYDILVANGMTPQGVYDFTIDIYNQALGSGDGSYSYDPSSGILPETINKMVEAFSTPAVGASGAVYGVLVAFGLLYPNTPLMLIFLPIPIKAKYFIPALLAIDLFSGITGQGLLGANIANWAHLGGALFGFIMAYYWKKNDKSNLRWD